MRQAFAENGERTDEPPDDRHDADDEEQEQRWLQSELYLLKGAWREAERLAAISDSLTIPGWIEARMERLKGGDDAAAPPAS